MIGVADGVDTGAGSRQGRRDRGERVRHDRGTRTGPTVQLSAPSLGGRDQQVPAGRSRTTRSVEPVVASSQVTWRPEPAAG